MGPKSKVAPEQQPPLCHALVMDGVRVDNRRVGRSSSSVHGDPTAAWCCGHAWGHTSEGRGTSMGQVDLHFPSLKTPWPQGAVSVLNPIPTPLLVLPCRNLSHMQATHSPMGTHCCLQLLSVSFQWDLSTHPSQRARCMRTRPTSPHPHPAGGFSLPPTRTSEPSPPIHNGWP